MGRLLAVTIYIHHAPGLERQAGLSFYVILIALLALVHLFVNLSSVLYARVLFRWFYLRRCEEGASEKVAVIVPCKGIDDYLYANLRSVATQDYPDYAVTFVTESREDPANSIIARVVAEHPHTRHLVAGIATTCGQKNHNLLAGVRANRDSDIYVFCDSDIRTAPHWLHNLVRPLALDHVGATSGFRWLIPSEQTVGATIHSMLNAYIGTFLTFWGSKVVWGGATAIRRTTFERLRVADTWSRTVVDDISLIALLQKHRVSTVYVPLCMSVSFDTAPDIGTTIEWFTRQIQYVRYYLSRLWLLALAVYAVVTLIVASGPMLLVAGLFNPELLYPGLVNIAFLLFLMFNYTLLKLNFADQESALRWFLGVPLALIVGAYSCLQTIFRRNMVWRGVTYEMDRQGIVTSIRRLS
jgi:ceramide glucosyltransferase